MQHSACQDSRLRLLGPGIWGSQTSSSHNKQAHQLYSVIAGFEGHYTNKSSGTREGEATFFRSSRFRLSSRLDVSLKDCFQDILTGFQQPLSRVPDAAAAQRAQRAQRHAQFKPLLQSSPQLAQVLLRVATVAQITLLEPVSSGQAPADQQPADSLRYQHQHQQASTVQQQQQRHQPQHQQQPTGLAAELVVGPNTYEAAEAQDPGQHSRMTQADASTSAGSLCVVNSHFFFHPHASHVRNMHAAAIMAEVEDFIHDHLCHTQSISSPAQRIKANASVPEPDTLADQATEAAPVQQAEQRTAAAGEVSHDGRLPEQAGARHRPDGPAVLMCGDLNCGLNHGTPGQSLLLLPESCKLVSEFIFISMP